MVSQQSRVRQHPSTRKKKYRVALFCTQPESFHPYAGEVCVGLKRQVARRAEIQVPNTGAAINRGIHRNNSFRLERIFRRRRRPNAPTPPPFPSSFLSSHPPPLPHATLPYPTPDPPPLSNPFPSPTLSRPVLRPTQPT